jgi:predicted NACHT family NTPase
MSEKIYNWKRFWCSHTSQVNLGDRGYLCDPESEYGHLLNPELVGLEAIADVPCLILLGEPGIGKSQEMKNLVKYTVESIQPSHPPLELNLRSCNNLATDLIKDQDFIDWSNGEHRLYLFLDSLDEGLLTIGNLATQLVDELSKNKYSDKLDRLYLRIACRTAVLPQFLEEGLQRLWPENLAIYELAPLRQVDVENAATEENIESQDFLSEVRDKALVPLAIKPLTLRFLLNIYKRNGNQFSVDQTLCSLYLEGCRLLCAENNLSRQGANQRGKLEPDQRLIIAARIAAITIFANRFAIWTGSNQGEASTEDVLLEQLILGNEFSKDRSIDVTESAIREVLDTGLFSSRGSNRIGWAHQTYAEFLAAWYLKQREVSLSTVKKLVFSSEDPEHKLISQLHETAAWLASMRSDVLHEVIKTDSDVLLRSDIPNDQSIQSLIVDNLLAQCNHEDSFDIGRDNYRRYSKLNHPGLSDQLRPYIIDSNKEIDVRDIAIDIAEVCKVYEIQEELVSLVLNPSESIRIRASAARSIGLIGEFRIRMKLRNLAFENILEDRDDQLHGYILRALWPDCITAQEIFDALTQPKTDNLIGAYSVFMNYKLVPKLEQNNLAVALKWLEGKGVRSTGHPFKEIGDAILLMAWNFFESPEIVEGFTRIALLQWNKHQKIITENDNKQSLSILEHSWKRRALIEQAVLIVTETENSFPFCPEKLFLSEDVFWMIKNIQESKSEKAQKIWAKIIERCFDRQNANQINAILVAATTNNILHNVFAFYFNPIKLDSIQARQQKDDYLFQKEQDNRLNPPLLNPLPRQRVIDQLESLEAGNLVAWCHLNSEMTLKPDSVGYHNNNDFITDLTKLPGWKDAEKNTKERIIKSAKKYILQENDISYEWIGTNSYNRPALAGCRAFQLLLKKDSDYLNNLNSEVWKKWAPVIIASPGNNPNLELIKLTYFNAPDKSIETLNSLINNKNYKHSVIDKFDKCWDEKLKSIFIKEVKNPLLSPQYFRELIEKFVKQKQLSDELRAFAKSLVVFPLPVEAYKREKILVVARMLIEDSDPSSWSFIWPIICQNPAFGREVFESNAFNYSHSALFDLTVKQISDLYIAVLSHNSIHGTIIFNG